MLHTWATTQTEGWWRQAFDVYEIPYDYIDPQTIRDTAEPAREVRRHRVRSWRQPGAGADGMPMWRNPIPYRHSTETPNIGTWAQTDDTRIGMGLAGPRCTCRQFIEAGGVFLGVEQQRRVRDQQQLHLRRQRRTGRGDRYARRRIAAAHEARRRDQPDRLRRSRQPRDVQRQRRQLHASAPTSAAAGAAAAAAAEPRLQPGGGRGGGGRRVRPAAARRTIPTSSRAVRRSRARTCRRCRRRSRAALAVRAADRGAAARNPAT